MDSYLAYPRQLRPRLLSFGPGSFHSAEPPVTWFHSLVTSSDVSTRVRLGCFMTSRWRQWGVTFAWTFSACWSGWLGWALHVVITSLVRNVCEGREGFGAHPAPRIRSGLRSVRLSQLKINKEINMTKRLIRQKD